MEDLDSLKQKTDSVLGTCASALNGFGKFPQKKEKLMKFQMLHLDSQEAFEKLTSMLETKLSTNKFFPHGYRIVHGGPSIINAVFESLTDQEIKHNQMTFTEQLDKSN